MRCENCGGKNGIKERRIKKVNERRKEEMVNPSDLENNWDIHACMGQLENTRMYYILSELKSPILSIFINVNFL